MGKIELKERFTQICKREEFTGRQKANTTEVTGKLVFMLTKKQTVLAYRWT